ncbi:hypothetical protein CXG81DRAFT_26039 [Caulochytrium protostelioides]|uniref:SLC41A/MgtE integral membrane domain-containing protein n=1 Tax=Caulochytrium protostelioides TaxID=1555241 RepID=A0A4P9X7R7_9FUNG|nr:hypothetical protein CXG81DRAFT_26039 [Caulochytrium protostelioides]|eukprot:RKP01278.1 hypothetical protein CXG81DRAFT_26039 [Caulochytrium protostelioides]
MAAACEMRAVSSTTSSSQDTIAEETGGFFFPPPDPAWDVEWAPAAWASSGDPGGVAPAPGRYRAASLKGMLPRRLGLGSGYAAIDSPMCDGKRSLSTNEGFETMESIALLSEPRFLELLDAQEDPKQLRHLIHLRRVSQRDDNDADRLDKTHPVRLAVLRSPAIVLVLLIEMLMGGIITQFSGVLQKWILLAAFLPILSSMAGTIGLQASTATLRGIAAGHVRFHGAGARGTVLRVLFRELASALAISAASGLILFCVGSIWAQSATFGAVTGAAVFLASVFGGLFGTFGPMLFHVLGIDPALAAGPFETGLQDLFGITVYLALATWAL